MVQGLCQPELKVWETTDDCDRKQTTGWPWFSDTVVASMATPPVAWRHMSKFSHIAQQTGITALLNLSIERFSVKTQHLGDFGFISSTSAQGISNI